jgi:hypothetical protein
MHLYMGFHDTEVLVNTAKDNIVLIVAFAAPLASEAFFAHFWRKPVSGTSTYEYER